MKTFEENLYSILNRDSNFVHDFIMKEKKCSLIEAHTIYINAIKSNHVTREITIMLSKNKRQIF